MIHSTIISDCVWIEPNKFEDKRGVFSETFKSSFLPHFKPMQTNYSFSNYFGVVLHETVLNSLYIPAYCGHAFIAMTDSVLVYQQDHEYDEAMDEAYCYNDYDINWPIPPTIISDKDKNCCDS